MHICRIEVVTIDAPGIVKYLGPLRAWIDPHFDVVDVYSSLTRLRLWQHRDDRPRVVAGVQDLLLISRNDVVPDTRDEDFIFALVQIIKMKRRPLRPASKTI